MDEFSQIFQVLSGAGYGEAEEQTFESGIRYRRTGVLGGNPMGG
jgi:hypothetical protein